MIAAAASVEKEKRDINKTHQCRTNTHILSNLFPIDSRKGGINNITYEINSDESSETDV